SRWAAASSNPDEIHCRGCQACGIRSRVLRSHVHSLISPRAGNITTRRKGLIRFRGKSARKVSTDSKQFAVRVALTTSPRLIGELSTRLETEYQLINANETPKSFKAIHVPPPGSDG